MRIVGIAGSVLSNAYVSRLLEAAGRELPARAELAVWDGLERVPPVEEGPLPSPLSRLCDRLARADGLLITAPAHSVLPPQLTHALDWIASQHGGTVLLGKPALVVTSCLRHHEAMWTQTRLQRALAAAGAHVQGADLAISPAFGHFDAEGRVTDAAVRARLRSALDHLRPPSAASSAAPIPAPRTPRTAQPGGARAVVRG
ncbi:NAD(P)H-dependent oxidoreductase [Sphaerisporangium sp. NPDC005288]|uniref:NADPH-dependent FMN reductase n=1 Tax=Sphaerisporangium sp. NPDC005288 TaxID=3155114 RepID=UPI0033B011C3